MSQRVLRKIDEPQLVAEGPGCWSCPSWQRKGGPGSAVGQCTDAKSQRHLWLTGYTSLCPAHPEAEPRAVADATRALVEGDGPDLPAIMRILQSP